MISKILPLLSLKQKIITLIAFAGILAGAGAGGYLIGYTKGGAREQVACANTETRKERTRANDAERQRDIANAPPASVDAMLDWLR